jgi:membrane-bound lytic murein transglycosylase B
MAPVVPTLITLGSLVLLASTLNLAHAAEDMAADPSAQAFIAEVVDAHGFDRREVEHLLSQAAYREDILSLMERPAESKPWHAYQAIFLTPERIAGGAAFRQAHAALLSRIGTQYGVDPSIIVAILGVETQYGRHLGRHRVLDALATLAFHYPKRAAFFRRELEQYLLLTREQGFDPLALKGSYAGAMGQPQFIASSYRAYAVDGNDDGRRDLWDSPADVIASVANYLAEHGWRRGHPVALPARVEGQGYRAFVGDGLRLESTLGQMQRHGVEPGEPVDTTQEAALIELQGEEGPEYWLGLRNFQVITRYNRSPKYAMAVYQLSRAIEARAPRRQQVDSDHGPGRDD